MKCTTEHFTLTLNISTPGSISITSNFCSINTKFIRTLLDNCPVAHLERCISLYKNNKTYVAKYNQDLLCKIRISI